MAQHSHKFRFFRSGLIVIVSVLTIVTIYRFTSAGSLSPTAAPAGTFSTLREIFNPLASGSYDSSSVTADADGSVLQVVKCIANRMSGGTCP